MNFIINVLHQTAMFLKGLSLMLKELAYLKLYIGQKPRIKWELTAKF